MILPFDGQDSRAESLREEAAMMAQEVMIVEKKQEPVGEKNEVLVKNVAVGSDAPETVPRKRVSKPVGKLSSTINIGIQDVLNPKKENGEKSEETLVVEESPFTFEDLERAWKEYALDVKREGRDRLHSTLTTSRLTMTSDYKISLEIGSPQQPDIDNEKENLLAFLRRKLRNGRITFGYTIVEVKEVNVMDSKATFDKLAEENEALIKFRKLFHLDIEY